MKKSLVSFVLMICILNVYSQTKSMTKIKLKEPSKSIDIDVMTALQNRKSTKQFNDKPITDQQLSDILWVAKGVNRPEENKMTSPTARNSQEIDVYVCFDKGVYLYDNQEHALNKVCDQDIRHLTEMKTPPSGAPIVLLIVADISRYARYNPDNPEEHERESYMTLIDSGIVSQNISLYCAGAGIGTVPRAMMEKEEIAKILNFTPTQKVWLNQAIGNFN